MSWQIKSEISYQIVANIAESILGKKVISLVKAHIDTKCIGTIMMELMKLVISILDFKTTTLIAPERWSDELSIKNFLAETQRSSLSELKTISFQVFDRALCALTSYRLSIFSCSLNLRGRDLNVMSSPLWEQSGYHGRNLSWVDKLRLSGEGKQPLEGRY